jgi:hypothetical protein
MGERRPMDDEGWKTPDSSWIDLEEEDDCQMYHVNVVKHESDIDEDCMSGTDASRKMDRSHRMELLDALTMPERL